MDWQFAHLIIRTSLLAGTFLEAGTTFLIDGTSLLVLTIAQSLT
jgi:hypothetical protein